jgi:molybdate transport system substrate-binding protein
MPWVALLLAAALPAPGSAAELGPTVAAAASLKAAFADLAALYQSREGAAVVLVSGATGSLALQLENGAPYDVFAAADEVWPRRLAARGVLEPGSLRVFARGVLALALRLPLAFSGAGPLGAEDLALLAGRDVRFVALPNPAAAPYGAAALEALARAGLKAALAPRLIQAGDVAQSLGMLESGNVEAAFTSAGLLGAPSGRWRPLSPDLHAPLTHMAGLAARSPRQAAARRFLALLLAPEGAAVLARHGFLPPAGGAR